MNIQRLTRFFITNLATLVALLASILLTSCSDISLTEIQEMDEQFQKLLEPSLDSGNLVSRNAKLQDFSDIVGQHLGTFTTTSSETLVKGNTAIRTYMGEYALFRGTFGSKGTAIIKVTFEKLGKHWTLVDAELKSPKFERVQAKN